MIRDKKFSGPEPEYTSVSRFVHATLISRHLKYEQQLQRQQQQRQQQRFWEVKDAGFLGFFNQMTSWRKLVVGTR